MAALLRRRHPRSGGQAIIELALVAPIFLFVSLALVELGRAVYYTQVLDSAARDGARYAVVHGFESACPSGPLPLKGSRPNTCDPTGAYVLATIRERAVGVVNVASAGYIVHAKWCDLTSMEAGNSACGDDLACGAWTGPGDTWPLGDGDNGRGQIATVCISYSYASLFKTFLPIPDFTVNARANLVVNH